jgi:hypothetical protein
MDDQEKPSLAKRLKWVLIGRPMSDEEIRAARAAGDKDPITRKRFDILWGRNIGGIAKSENVQGDCTFGAPAIRVTGDGPYSASERPDSRSFTGR